MKTLKRYLVAVVCLVSGGIVLTWAVRPVPVSVETCRVARGPLMVTIDAEGKTRVKERYIVCAPLSGVISRIEFHAGDMVEANATVLATIEPTKPALLDARLLAEAESKVKAAEAAKELATARLEAAREAHGLAKHDLARAQSLIQTKAISQAEYDSTEHQERMAEANLRAADFGNRVAMFEFDVAKAAFVRTQPEGSNVLTAGRLEIRSPVSGRVLRVAQESSTVVSPGQQLMEIGDIGQLEVEVDVLSVDAASILPGAKVYLERWGGPSTLSARVRLIEPSGFTKVSSLGVEEQRVNVIADFEDSHATQKNLGDAYRVDARIVVWESADVMKIPSGALFRSGNDWSVFTIIDDRAQLRTISVGHMNNQEVEVLNGISVGDELIEFPSDKIRSGSRVTRAKISDQAIGEH